MSEHREEHVDVEQGHTEEKDPNISKPINFPDDVAEEEHRQNRLSAYSFSNLPEVVPADTYQGKVVVHDDNKETITNPKRETVWVENFPELHVSHEEHSKEAVPIYTKSGHLHKSSLLKERLNRKLCGLRAKWVLLGLVSLILVFVVLGIGLGVGLGSSHTSKARSESQSGAFNGTKIALGTQTFATNAEGGSEENLVMYFQHWTGQIRWMRLSDNGHWSGGDSSSIVATDAKNNTPISVVSYVWDGVSFWRVFYIDNTNLIKEVWAGNNTQGWALGPLSDQKISPMNDDHVGLVACWAGPTSPAEYAEGYATTTDATRLVIRIIYAKNATSFQQMSYRGDTQLWTMEQTLTNLNGHATPTCFNPGQGTIEYVMAVDLNNAINVYWRDTNTNLTNTTSHPINQWTNASIAISNIEDSATLGYTKYLYAQDVNDRLIRAYNISFAAENTTLDTGSGFVVQGNPGLPSTGLGITAQPDPAGGDDVLALYQTDRSGISYYKRNPDGVSWTSTNVDIPLI